MVLAHFYLATTAIAVVGLFIAFILLKSIRIVPVTDQKAAQIALFIKKGVMTFLREEYKLIVIFAFFIVIFVGFVINSLAALMFIMGALSSMSTRFIGMIVATDANVRTTVVAKKRGERAAFFISFFGGGVMGIAVASFGLLGVGTVFYFFHGYPLKEFILLLISFGLGSSLIAFFARVGGGIYTKSAAVGVDLVGKVEAGIPEDDPRNSAVITDNVGEYVGDMAGMGADIYESYVCAMVSSIILATTAYSDANFWVFPLVLAALGLIGSIGGLISVGFASIIFNLKTEKILLYGTYIAVIIFLASTLGFFIYINIDLDLFVSIVLGCLSGLIIGKVTEYYTGGKPIRKIAKASQSGAATNLIYGLSVGMESIVVSVVLLALVVLFAFKFGGSFGVSLAAVSMLATVGITMTISAYGPIATSSHGVAEISGFGKPVKKITGRLDRLGNMTAAIGKGFAINSVLLVATALFLAYVQEAGIKVLDIIDSTILAGLFIGATIPFIISALTMRSVGNAALQIVVEVRRQLKEISDIMKETENPYCERYIAISTKASLKQMVLPGIITIALPVIIKLSLGNQALGGFFVGTTVVGVLLALMMVNGGSAWNNAKKFIEVGHFGGKGSDAHKATVIGGTVGASLKDTSGQALSVLIKLISSVSLLLVLI